MTLSEMLPVLFHARNSYYAFCSQHSIRRGPFSCVQCSSWIMREANDKGRVTTLTYPSIFQSFSCSSMVSVDHFSHHQLLSCCGNDCDQKRNLKTVVVPFSAPRVLCIYVSRGGRKKSEVKKEKEGKERSRKLHTTKRRKSEALQETTRRSLASR